MNNPSIIAAIISKGNTINKKIKIELENLFLSSAHLFFEKIKNPSFNPSPKEIKIAGNSKIPWGNKRINEPNPSSPHTLAKTYPKTNPLDIALITGTIPKHTPDTKEYIALLKLFLNIK